MHRLITNALINSVHLHIQVDIFLCEICQAYINKLPSYTVLLFFCECGSFHSLVLKQMHHTSLGDEKQPPRPNLDTNDTPVSTVFDEAVLCICDRCLHFLTFNFITVAVHTPVANSFTVAQAD